MKDENSQVSETFDEQEQLRSEKRGLLLFFAGLVCFFIAFGFYYRRNIFPEVSCKKRRCNCYRRLCYLWYRSSYSSSEKISVMLCCGKQTVRRKN